MECRQYVANFTREIHMCMALTPSQRADFTEDMVRFKEDQWMADVATIEHGMTSAMAGGRGSDGKYRATADVISET